MAKTGKGDRRRSQDGNDREEKKEDVMSMTIDETDEAYYSLEGRNHTTMNDCGRRIYVVTQWPSGREADG